VAAAIGLPECPVRALPRLSFAPKVSGLDFERSARDWSASASAGEAPGCAGAGVRAAIGLVGLGSVLRALLGSIDLSVGVAAATRMMKLP
jgi:hypothetical protein